MWFENELGPHSSAKRQRLERVFAMMMTSLLGMMSTNWTKTSNEIGDLSWIAYQNTWFMFYTNRRKGNHQILMPSFWATPEWQSCGVRPNLRALTNLEIATEWDKWLKNSQIFYEILLSQYQSLSALQFRSNILWHVGWESHKRVPAKLNVIDKILCSSENGRFSKSWTETGRHLCSRIDPEKVEGDTAQGNP
jgi:hypothetical protein